MNAFQIIILIGLSGNALIGSLVWISNPKRALNRYFLLTTALIALWLLCMFAITVQSSPDALTFWTRQTDVAAGFLPLGFFILQVVILNPEITFFKLCYRLRYLLILSLSVLVLCQTQFFMQSAYFSSPDETIPIVIYGSGIAFYILYFVLMTIGMVVSVPKIFRSTTGVQRTESQFLLLGWLGGFSFGLMLFTSAVLLGTQEATRFLPLFALVLDGFVAYGIATRRILSVSVVLQRLSAYLLMTVYLIGLYVGSVWLVGRFFYLVVSDTFYLSHLLAALVVAFSVMPAQSWMQRVSSLLFFSSKTLDLDRVLGETRHIFQEVVSEDLLTAAFSSLIIQTFKTTRVVLLKLEQDGVYRQHYMFPEKDETMQLEADSGLVHLLKRDHKPFTIDTLERMRFASTVLAARQEMKTCGVSVAVGSFARQNLEVILLLCPKSSGEIYDVLEQRALQLLCDQLAVALENAKLYTAIQNGKIYNDILLDSLTSGIVAVDEAHTVTVFNKRAQSLAGLSENEVVGAAVDRLPASLARLVERIFQTGSAVRDLDTFIESGDVRIPIRVSGSVFHGYTGETLGALIVFNDMTMLRKMEEQIRRTDRLSSIGTLSAGMAHEIKNPLVTIKTFTELLPVQYGDTEFRQTFFDLVGQEVKRIDTIVNRLLNFARPAKASLKPVSLHDVLENSIHLVEQQLVKHQIRLEKDLAAERSLIQGDAEQLNQTFINFFLNATQAMAPGGTLSVKTFVLKSSVQVDVKDTGCGLSDEKRKHIFDPFFTTKENGVGLGLSVSHGIIQEHKGAIDVESEEGRGTVFHVLFPLIAEKE